MSATLERRAEILKLARVLGVDPPTLGYLDAVAPDDLRRVREQVTDACFDGDRDRLRKVAFAAKAVPGAIAARLAQIALGPVLCARVTGLLDPRKAVDIARRVPDAFLADIAVELDPRRAATVIAAIPVDTIARVARILSGRRAWVEMGQFVLFLDDPRLRAAIDAFDDVSLLRVAFVIEGKERLDHFIGLLSPDRLDGVLRTADREGLWPEALDLLDHVAPDRLRDLGDRAAALGVLEGLVGAILEQDLVDALLPIVPGLSPDTQAALAHLEVIRDERALLALVDATERHGLWTALLPLVTHMPPTSRDEVARLAARLDPDRLTALVTTVHEHRLWSTFVPLAAEHMDDAGLERVAEVVGDVDERIVRDMADEVTRHHLWEPLLRIAGRMRSDQLDRIADRLLADGLDERIGPMLHATRSGGLWPIGVRILGGLDATLLERLSGPTAALDPDLRAMALAEVDGLGMRERLGPLGRALAT
ncbi:MAG: hypothetical protein M0P31_01500 [Solirubrobacteraceae bacterium]|nr:hypothetical protein [Solirubrobacteraceae bacterium]